jgi:uncharacterized protein
MNTIQSSPLAQWQSYCKQEKLAYQKDSLGNAVFYPRVLSPETGQPDLSWHVSAGLGTVYSVTTMFSKGAPTGNIALIDLDEGFRMLSSVRTETGEQPEIGMRVQVRFESGQDAEAVPVPVFVPVAGGRS